MDLEWEVYIRWSQRRRAFQVKSDIHKRQERLHLQRRGRADVGKQAARGHPARAGSQTAEVGRATRT